MIPTGPSSSTALLSLATFVPSYSGTSADPSLPSFSSKPDALRIAAAANFPCRTRYDVEVYLEELKRAGTVTDLDRQKATIVAYEVGSFGGGNRQGKKKHERKFILVLEGYAQVGDGSMGGYFSRLGKLVGVPKRTIER